MFWKRKEPLPDPDADLFEEGLEQGEAIELDITDVLDLHSFPPKDQKQVVLDYLDLAAERGWSELRIIHGRGVGVQRKMVRTLLERDARVASFGDAPGEGGGWGATIVTLRSKPSSSQPTE